MHHNLEWLHDLDVLYDSSTFDTDPFEPQPDGVNTIFPFWVPAPGNRFTDSKLETRNSPSAKPGYIELPYTLPQDFTLFLLLQEPSIEIWKRKLDWIASHGGMAMLDIHPDYVDLSGNGQPGISYPARFYAEFLQYVRKQYGDSFWLALPHQVAEFAKKSLVPELDTAAGAAAISSISAIRKEEEHGIPSRGVPRRVSDRPRQRIWIDLDNTPHVPFFEPIIEELTRSGFDVILTARDAFQVCELATQKGLQFRKIGRHYGKNKFLKLVGLFYRALQLAPFALREKPDLALSHGARSQIIICNLLRIPTILMADYEFAQYPPLMRPTWEMVPDVIPDSSLCCSHDRIRKYPGIKEDVYISRMKRDPQFLAKLGLSPDELLITVRPPATEAHYHNPEGEKLFVHFMERACRQRGLRVVLLPRNARQGEVIQKNWPAWFENGRTVIPRTAVDGLNLLWYSDLVVSGGGTMNREAAALGVPVYSIFRGKTGAIDLHLQEQGRLVMVESVEDVDRKIVLRRRDRNGHVNGAPSAALSVVVRHISDIAALEPK
jgi:predicted glycosyltransferase